ncbi:leukocyte elastase inhibitor isoform X4 [Anabrus simplex]|uniref:leukocyte elastase inhibitor isoform X4 n=1 Tax=Anabrus simplex TaxID=316456 RepID=UPI0035A2E4FE
MKICRPLLSAVVLCLHMLGMNGDEAATVQSEQSLNAAVAAVNTFSKSLYKELSTTPGNLVVSPFSVEAVVAMLYLGLRGETASRVSAALHLPNNHSLVQQGFQSLFGTLQNSDNVTLEIANKIYIEKTFNVKDEFRQSTATYFQSDAEAVDIKTDAENVRIAVNDWAAGKTHDKIKDLLAPGTLTADVVMVLLNAIYFKGLWKTPFDKDFTYNRNFYLDNGSSKSVPMMNLNKYFPYAELYEENLRALKLPYQGGKFSMLLLLPERKNGLEQLESNIENLDVPRIMSRLSEIKTTVVLPRFKILNTIDLKAPLQNLGMGELFTFEADFTGITDEKIAISKALQKAYIEVNEEGTEAAAVTALTTTFGSALGARHGMFIADYPFMYMIIEEGKGAILFIGRVTEPVE